MCTKEDLYNGMKFQIITVWTLSDINLMSNKCVITSGSSCESWSLDHVVSHINSGSWTLIDYKKPETIDTYQIF